MKRMSHTSGQLQKVVFLEKTCVTKTFVGWRWAGARSLVRWVFRGSVENHGNITRYSSLFGILPAFPRFSVNRACYYVLRNLDHDQPRIGRRMPCQMEPSAP